MPTGLISEAIVSLARCSTVRLARSGSGTSRLFGGRYRPHHVGLHEMVPAARAAHLDDVHRELFLRRGQTPQFVGRSGRARQRPELLTEHPRHVCELFLSADRAHDVTAATVELGGPEQVRIGVAHCTDARPARVHLREQRPSLKGVVHHLSLKSHGDQSTCGERHAGRAPSVVCIRRGRNYASPVPTRLSPSTRARDVDRTNTCATLDEARADGQLSEEEHAARIDLAMEASTLADLHSLIEDLQNETDLAPMADPIALAHPVRTATASKIGFFAVTVPLVAALVALTFGIRSCAADPEPGTVGGGMGYQDPAVIADIAQAVLEKTGTTVVDSLGLYPDYAVVWMPGPGTPQKQVDYDYRDGVLEDFDDDWSSKRSADQQQVDLTTLDLQKISGIVAGAAESLNLSRIDRLNIQIRGDHDGPEVLISADNTDQESGSMAVDPAGNFLYVTPFSFGE